VSNQVPAISSDNISQKLTDFLTLHLPIIDYKGMSAELNDGHTLTLKAPLAPNFTASKPPSAQPL